MTRADKARTLQRCHGLRIRRRHGAQLQVATRQLVSHAGRGSINAFGEPQAFTLVLLGIGQPGVHGQHGGRITAAGGHEALGARGSQEQPFARRPPKLTRQRARHHARWLKKLPIAHQAVTRELDIGGIWPRCPLLDDEIRFDHALSLKQALGAAIAHLIQSRVDLATHGICRNADHAANAGAPRRPSVGVERRRAHQRHIRATGETLCRRDANAHPRERTGPASNQKPAHVLNRLTDIRQGRLHRIDQLDVRMPAAQMVTRGQDLHARTRGRVVKEHLGRPPGNRAREHVRRGVNRHNQRAKIVQLHRKRPSKLQSFIQIIPGIKRGVPRSRSHAPTARPGPQRRWLAPAPPRVRHVAQARYSAQRAHPRRAI